MTQRSAFVLEVRPERIDEYVEAHRAVWPEMLDALRRRGHPELHDLPQRRRRCSGTSNPTIWRPHRASWQQQDVSARWQDAMAELLEDRVPDAGPPRLEEVFRLDLEDRIYRDGMSAEPGKSPSPSGTKAQPPRFRLGWWWIAALLVLFAINYWAGSRATHAQSRVRVPYSPFFLQQVGSGDVAEITSKGTAIQGTFKKAESYQGSKPSTRFRTEIPAFADTVSLSKLLEEKGVVVNAVPLDKGLPWWESLLVGFGPTILFVGLLFLLLRRGSRMQNVLGSFGRSRARRYEPSGDRVTFADVAGIDEAKARVVGGRGLPAQAGQVRAASAGASRTACCCRARRGPARRCWRARSQARRTRRSSRCRRRSSSRRSSGSARRGCATCSRRPRRRRRRSCSSTSSTRSAARAPRASPASAAATTSASRR